MILCLPFLKSENSKLKYRFYKARFETCLIHFRYQKLILKISNFNSLSGNVPDSLSAREKVLLLGH